MKRQLLAFSLLVAFAAPASAGTTPWGDFRNRVTGANLKPFALDLGGLLGSSAFHSGRSLGFPGFDISVLGMTQFRPDADNAILRGSGVEAFGLPMVQAEIGLPAKIDVIAHGVTGAGARIFGAGLRYGLLRSGTLVRIPDVSISGFVDKVDHTYFTAEHYSLNAAASWHLPVLHPYIGAGWDLTRVKVGEATTTALEGSDAWARGTRLSVGLDVSPLPLLHVFAAYSLRNANNSGVDFGLGARF